LGNPRGSHGRLWERLLTGDVAYGSFSLQTLSRSSTGFLEWWSKLSRAGCLQEWLQGGLQLYFLTQKLKKKKTAKKSFA